jgi:hypothetical protein
MTPSS